MRIRITAAAPISDGRGNRYSHGSTPDVDDRLARDWITAGLAAEHTPDQAEPAAEPAAPAERQPRKATKAAPRKAVTR